MTCGDNTSLRDWREAGATHVLLLCHKQLIARLTPWQRLLAQAFGASSRERRKPAWPVTHSAWKLDVLPVQLINPDPVHPELHYLDSNDQWQPQAAANPVGMRLHPRVYFGEDVRITAADWFVACPSPTTATEQAMQLPVQTGWSGCQVVACPGTPAVAQPFMFLGSPLPTTGGVVRRVADESWTEIWTPDGLYLWSL